MERFQRRAEEVMMLIRGAFLRGISTRQVGRVVAILSEEAVSAQTVSKLSRGESQAAWEGFLNPLYARGLTGNHLLLMVTDGCAGADGGDPDRLPAREASALLGA